MKNLFKRLIFSSIVLDIIVIIFGLFLVKNPEMVMNVSIILIGIFLIINGLYAIIKYVFNNNILFKYNLFIGLISIIFGIIMMINPVLFSNMITVIIGLWIILNSLIKLMLSIKLKYFKEETWLINAVISIIGIILGMLLMINPFKGSIAISCYIGIILILNSSFDILEKSLFYKRMDNIKKIIFK